MTEQTKTLEQTKANDVNVQDLEEVVDKKPVNLRVQRFLLLSAKKLTYTPKGTKKETEAMSIHFLDAADCDPFTRQPNINGFTPVVSIFCKELSPAIAALENTEVFSPVYAKISGNENFTQLHGILTEAQMAVYREIMDGLV